MLTAQYDIEKTSERICEAMDGEFSTKHDTKEEEAL